MENYLKTILLLGILSVFVILLGGAIGGQGGLYTAFLFAILMNGAAYFFSDKLALSASRAKPVSKKEAPEIYKLVGELADEMHIPMPKIYMTPDNQANAFATGRDPSHASVALTRGILGVLSPAEIKAVLAHELGHVLHRDILIVSIAAVLASVITFISQMGFYGGFGNSDNRDRNEGLGLVLALFAPVAAMIIQLAISRQREYGADEEGARVLKTGKPLAQALLKISGSTKMMPNTNLNPAFSSLYIANPFGGTGGAITNLFSTHPPVEDRVKRLLSMSFK